MWDVMEPEARKKMYEAVGKSLLVGRIGNPDEIAEAYLFLMKSVAFLLLSRWRCSSILLGVGSLPVSASKSTEAAGSRNVS